METVTRCPAWDGDGVQGLSPPPRQAGKDPAMRYISTRGQAAPRDFEAVLLAGLAEDGGLFVPETWPTLTPAEWRALRGLPYPDLAARILALFGAGGLPLEAMCRDAYAGFGHAAVVPLVQLDHRTFALTTEDLRVRSLLERLHTDHTSHIGDTPPHVPEGAGEDT